MIWALIHLQSQQVLTFLTLVDNQYELILDKPEVEAAAPTPMETTEEEEKTKENGDSASDPADADAEKQPPKELKETPSKSKAKRGVKARTGTVWLLVYSLRQFLHG